MLSDRKKIEMTLQGKHIIGFQLSAESDETFQSVNPATGELLPTKFHDATSAELDFAANQAARAFRQYREKSGSEKAAFLEQIALEIEGLGEALVAIATAETGLPDARILGERGRTAGQLRLFAQLLKDGSWVNARIENAIPDRQPLPKVDIRMMERPLGPVGVFGASNFPLAFSVAGGDTASALAAGCPVIVKAHPAHPGTSALVGSAIAAAARKSGMPDGVFSLLFGTGNELGSALVRHPNVKAIGFTGSFRGGMALVKLASQRSVPIPVYAEMGSTNPVFVLPKALKEKGNTIAQQFAGSVTLGVGQFCTNPGMMIVEKSAASGAFDQEVTQAFKAAKGGVMLTSGIQAAYESGVTHHRKTERVVVMAEGEPGAGSTAVTPVLFGTDAAVVDREHSLSEEVFGPTSVLVHADSKEQLLRIAEAMDGHLTATVHGTEEELGDYADLLAILEQKVGRLIINGFPTGVEVCHAMMHGGPYPASSDSRSTSVGTAAIYRFTRPVSFQGFPDRLLPAELQRNNPLGIWRLSDGQLAK
jgi:NADP-dependent aldehyde dehydrogenase